MTDEDLPKVFIGIPSGPSKDYAMLPMVWALENLQWANAEIHWACTYNGNPEGEKYIRRLETIMGASKWKCPWSIHWGNITKEEESIPYRAVIRNRRLLRGKFLDGDCDYFFMVGGDNPPIQTAVKRLMKFMDKGADVAFGVSHQRPKRDAYNPEAVYPMVWKYAWTLDELGEIDDPDLYEEFWKTALNVTLYIPMYVDPNWRRKKRIWGVAGGDGNCLIRREVLENAGWTLPGKYGSSYGYHSEDLHFFNKVNMLGYSTVVDMQYHVPHLHENGRVY